MMALLRNRALLVRLMRGLAVALLVLSGLMVLVPFVLWISYGDGEVGPNVAYLLFGPIGLTLVTALVAAIGLSVVAMVVEDLGAIRDRMGQGGRAENS